MHIRKGKKKGSRAYPRDWDNGGGLADPRMGCVID